MGGLLGGGGGGGGGKGYVQHMQKFHDLQLQYKETALNPQYTKLQKKVFDNNK